MANQLDNKEFNFKRCARSKLTFLSAIIIGICGLCFLLEPPVHAIMFQFVDDRSEYRLREQLTKLFLILTILIAIYSYLVSMSSLSVKISVSYLFLAMSIYLAESNMLAQKAQPIFGVLGIGIILLFLYQAKKYMPLFTLFLGLVTISMGSVSDIIHDHETVQNIIPAPIHSIVTLIASQEEYLDLFGIAFVFLSAIIFYYDKLETLFLGNVKNGMLILVFSGLLAAGNGFLHYQYNPSEKLYALALVLTLVSYTVVAITLQKLLKSQNYFTKIETRPLFIMVLFVLFCILPATYGVSTFITSLVLWLPALIFFCVYLYKNHMPEEECLNQSVRR